MTDTILQEIPDFAINSSCKILLPDGRNYAEKIISVSGKTSGEILKIMEAVDKIQKEFIKENRNV